MLQFKMFAHPINDNIITGFTKILDKTSPGTAAFLDFFSRFMYRKVFFSRRREFSSSKERKNLERIVENLFHS